MGVSDMTGIERLRELAEGVLPTTAVCGVTKTAYDREHMEVAGDLLRDFLADIADQIEAEQEERVTRRLEDRDAAEWVRERGGIAYVRDAWRVRSNLDRQLAVSAASASRSWTRLLRRCVRASCPRV